ncbi:hypothetical protein HPG69_008823 [Diceros bicornis minor]|uniref:B30.2/SPRY domain-containing protein n=1 Tax=Diceros bicornis minor TaxID=77932 RepID=A0A7J7FAQ7_DICBM|nr:hypothetical protein HPG69_008823 [Diceros bicornis minor]
MRNGTLRLSQSSKLLIEMKGHENGGIQLECTSVGWYPEPQVVWRDTYGEIVPALEEVYTVDADSLFMVTTAVIIRDPSVRNVSCSINSTLLGQEKETVIVIPEYFIPSTSSPWMVALAVIVPTLLLLITGSICLIKKLHREKRDSVKRKRDLKPKPETSSATDVVLDPDTAHPELFLSEDQRCMRWIPSRQSMPDNTERFNCQPYLLLREMLLGGGGQKRDGWAVGVCRDDVERKGEALLVPQNGFWALEMFGIQYRALSSPEKIFSLTEHLRHVGTFLDYEIGHVSFYDMRDRSHICTCPRLHFSGPLRPFFRLGSDDSLLFIYPAFTGAQEIMVPESGLTLHRAGTHHSHQNQFPCHRAK